MNERRNIVIYSLEIRHPLHGVVARYIGQSCQFIKRTQQHLHALRAKRHENWILQSRYNDLGEAAVTFDVLEVGLTAEEADEREEFHMRRVPAHLYANIQRAPKQGRAFRESVDRLASQIHAREAVLPMYFA